MKKEEIQKTTNDNSCGLASVVLGIVSIVVSSFGGVLLGIVGLVFAFKQKQRFNNKWATAGQVLNIIGILIGIILFIIAIKLALGSIDSVLPQLQAASAQ